MDKYYMKKFNHFADFIKAYLNEEFSKLEISSYIIEEKYNRATIMYIKIDNNEHQLCIPIDFNISLSKILDKC